MNKTIETSLNREGYNAEIEIGEGVITGLGFFLGQDDAEAYKVLKNEVIEFLDEVDASEGFKEDSQIEEEIIIATEDKRDASTYDSVVLKLTVTVDEFGDITGEVSK